MIQLRPSRSRPLYDGTSDQVELDEVERIVLKVVIRIRLTPVPNAKRTLIAEATTGSFVRASAYGASVILSLVQSERSSAIHAYQVRTYKEQIVAFTLECVFNQKLNILFTRESFSKQGLSRQPQRCGRRGLGVSQRCFARKSLMIAAPSTGA